MDRYCCDELMVYCGLIGYKVKGVKRQWECIKCGRQTAEPYYPTLPAVDGSRVLLDRIKELEEELRLLNISIASATAAWNALGESEAQS